MKLWQKIALALLIVFCSTGIVGSLCAAERPNLVLIIADDCTWSDLGCYGGQARTPHLNEFAEEGMQFERCFQAAPMCSPTRHNIYTGLYPVTSGAYPNHTFARDGTRSIAHYLQPLGYRIHLSGKKHIQPREVFPFEYSGKRNNPDMQAIGELMSECRADDQPFCLLACSNEPHTPWNRGDASQYDADELEFPPYIPATPHVREQFTKYLAEITYFDHQVGQILKLLDQHQLTGNTLVMVLSEQGNCLPFAKWTCYDAGLRSGMLVRWPGHVEPGSKTKAMVEYIDILPTFVEAAGGKPADVLQGKSFLPVLRRQNDEHKSHVFGIMTTRGINNGSDCYPIRSVRSQNHLLIWNLNSSATFQNACTASSEFQSMLKAAEAGDDQAEAMTERYQHRPEYELYAVKDDPHNMRNLADEPSSQAVLADLKQRLESWMDAQGDEGIETELAAGEHQKRNRRKAKNRKK